MRAVVTPADLARIRSLRVDACRSIRRPSRLRRGLQTSHFLKPWQVELDVAPLGLQCMRSSASISAGRVPVSVHLRRASPARPSTDGSRCAQIRAKRLWVDRIFQGAGDARRL